MNIGMINSSELLEKNNKTLNNIKNYFSSYSKKSKLKISHTFKRFIQNQKFN